MDSNNRWHPGAPDWIARSLLIATGLLLLGTVCTATIGAALWPIPLIGMVALLFVPFPTLALYVGAIALIYLLILMPVRLAGTDSKIRRRLALAGAAGLVVLAGFVVPLVQNARAGVYDELADTWQPARLRPGSNVALVQRGGDYKQACDAFCLSLLVTGRARSILLAQTDGAAARGTRLPALSIGLAPGWQACLGTLPDYSPVVRDFPQDRREGFIEQGLDFMFQDELKRCLRQSPARLVIGQVPTCIIWDGKTDEQGPPRPGWRRPHAEQRIALPVDGAEHRRLIRIGHRYTVPFAISPYGGNAGTGGRFEPMQAMIQIISRAHLAEAGMYADGASWWDFITDGQKVAEDAIRILDRMVSDRRCIIQPGPCVFERAKDTLIPSSGFDNGDTAS